MKTVIKPQLINIGLHHIAQEVTATFIIVIIVEPNEKNVTALIACLNRIYFNAKNAFLINLECGVVIRDGYQYPEPSFHLDTNSIRATRLVEHNLAGGDRGGQAAPACVSLFYY